MLLNPNEYANRFEFLKFKYGFFGTTSGTPYVNPHWGVFQVDSFYFTYDKTIEFSSKIGEGVWLLVFGKIVSLNCSSNSHSEVTKHLFNSLSSSIESFYDELDYCCGRFIIVYSINGKIRALNDAGGMKAIYYTSGESVSIASHAGILAQILNKKKSHEVLEDIANSRMQRVHNVAYLPGFVTIYDDILSLCPNTELCVDNASVYRYFPRKLLEDWSLEESVHKASSLLKTLFKKWLELYPIAIPITAGMDSRVTTSTTREHTDNVLFFTYVKKNDEINISDYSVAIEMLKRYGLTSMLLTFDYPYRADGHCIREFNQFKSVMQFNVEFEHFFPLAFEYYNEFPRDYLILRSDMGELSRARPYQSVFDLARNEKPLARSFAAMHNLWNRRKKITEFSIKAFNQYIEETNLTDSCFNYYVYDLLYWENYMGRWQPSALAENDAACDSASLFNCRAVLKACLSAPFEDRLAMEVQMGIIRSLWPDLLAAPINPVKKKAKERNYFVVPKLDISNTDSRYVFTVSIDRNDCHFAFYLYEDDEIVQRQDYSEENCFRVNLDRAGHYRVKCFIVRADQPDKNRCRGDENKVSAWFKPVSIY